MTSNKRGFEAPQYETRVSSDVVNATPSMDIET